MMSVRRSNQGAPRVNSNLELSYILGSWREYERRNRRSMTIAVAYHSFGSPFVSNLLAFWVAIEVLHDTLLRCGGEYRSSHFAATKLRRSVISLTACFRRIHLYPCKSTLPPLGCRICHPSSDGQCPRNLLLL